MNYSITTNISISNLSTGHPLAVFSSRLHSIICSNDVTSSINGGRHLPAKWQCQQSAAISFLLGFLLPSLSLPWDWPLNLAAVLVTRSLLLRSPPHKVEVENKLISARQNRRALCLDLRIIIQLARLNSTPFEWLMKDSHSLGSSLNDYLRR